MVMLDDGAKAKGGALEVRDVAQVVAESVGVDGRRPRTPAGVEASPETP
jgi:hypothetical protein